MNAGKQKENMKEKSNDVKAKRFKNHIRILEETDEKGKGNKQ